MCTQLIQCCSRRYWMWQNIEHKGTKLLSPSHNRTTAFFGETNDIDETPCNATQQHCYVSPHTQMTLLFLLPLCSCNPPGDPADKGIFKGWFVANPLDSHLSPAMLCTCTESLPTLLFLHLPLPLSVNIGLAPFLFALLIVQSLFPASSEKSPLLWNLRRTHIQLVLCLANTLPKTIVWWAGTGVVVGFIAAIAISIQRRLGHWGGKVKTSTVEKQGWEQEVYAAMLEEDEAFSDSTMIGESVPFKERKSGGSIWTALAYILPTMILVLMVLVGTNQVHTFRPEVTNDMINTSIEPHTPYLLTLVLMTAPRKRGVTYIKETLSSYLANFPDEEVDPLYSRIQIVVYTHFTDFPGYDEAKAYFDTIPKARKHVRWVREEGSEKSQRKHLMSAIRKIGTMEDSVYMGVMEDDFPFCEGGWQEMLNTLYAANQKVQNHCGVFVGTGGSGLIFKRSVALTASFILEEDIATHAQGLHAPPPDISLQNCLLGEHEFCSSCAGTMVISRTLLQRHLGYNSSTSGGGYDKNQFQCGWRQPFNGLPYVHTL
ncbi:hypothetical protein B0O80DRAFT_480398 [Mortierella sp. GBAus27b]|nr:hypothetical protein B0O80DRAFT_480398 [Mortierella sp. GBAus27b]